MKYNRLILLAVFLVSVSLIGCAAKPQIATTPFTPKKFAADQYAPKVDNFMVLFDASFSMRWKYKGLSKFDIAKYFVTYMNQTLPEVGYNGALRSFGHNSIVSKNPTQLFYGITRYTTAGLSKGLESIKTPGGNTPMTDAITAATDDLKSTSGSIAVILISDGEDLGTSYPMSAAKAMKKKFGDRVCIYTVLVGDSAGGKKLLDQITKIGKCGFTRSAEDLVNSSDAMADFVEEVFLTKKPPMAKAAPKPMAGAKDSDFDGVPDSMDRCPNTPSWAPVDKKGCWNVGAVYFDFDKSSLQPKYKKMLKKLAETLEGYPMVNIRVEGNTDSVGSAEYNQRLSNKRAGVVKKYLQSMGVNGRKIGTIGFGESNPAEKNDTAEGRAKNRRANIKQQP